jgi:hypothetical protein
MILKKASAGSLLMSLRSTIRLKNISLIDERGTMTAEKKIVVDDRIEQDENGKYYFVLYKDEGRTLLRAFGPYDTLAEAEAIQIDYYTSVVDKSELN